jgi:hypothetical protein
MMAARRTTRFIAALALAGLMLGSSPLAPGSLAASTQPAQAGVSSALLCDYIAQAIAFLEGQRPSFFRNFLLAQLGRISAAYCR